MAESTLVKRSDIFHVPFSKLKTIDGFNLPDRERGIEALAESIYHNGAKMPLKGYKDGDHYVVIVGHRRMAAGKLIMDRYKKNVIYQFLTYPKGTSHKDLLLEHFLTNDNAELTPLQKAHGVARLIEEKMKPKEIARTLAVSEVYIGNLKKLDDAPEAAKELVRKGVVSATLLIQELKKKGGDIMEFIERAKAQGSAVDAEQEKPTKKGKKAKASSTKTKTAKVTEKDLAQNSVKELKRFIKLTEKDRPTFNKGAEPVYEFCLSLIKNKFTYQDILNFFTNGK